MSFAFNPPVMSCEYTADKHFVWQPALLTSSAESISWGLVQYSERIHNAQGAHAGRPDLCEGVQQARQNGAPQLWIRLHDLAHEEHHIQGGAAVRIALRSRTM